MKSETFTVHPLTWTNDHPPTTCSKCGKEVKLGRLLGYEEGETLPYCWHCGISRFYEFWRGKFDEMPRRGRSVQ